MKTLKIISLIFICALSLISTVHAEKNILKGKKIGLAYDRGIGLIINSRELSGFIGKEGISVDYAFKKKALNEAELNSLTFYAAGGVYADWDRVRGIRVPIGGEIYFAKNLDTYAQIMPRLSTKEGDNFGIDLAAGVRYHFQ